MEAVDLSDVCAYMTYLQLSLYGIPAIVYCGNTLTQEMRFKMETPSYFIQYWKFQKSYNQNNQKDIEQNESNNKSNLFNEVIIKGNSQLSLW